MQDFTDSPPIRQAETLPRRWTHIIWWLLGGVATITIVSCSGAIVYLGIYSPETSVYTGNRIPSQYLRTIESVGGLDDDEKILYFYSDAMTDIRDGFYFVSNKKVVIYLQATDTPLTIIPFEDIVETDLYRDESFFEDSQITLYLREGQVYSFPVSSEYNRDQQFYDVILNRTGEITEL